MKIVTGTHLQKNESKMDWRCGLQRWSTCFESMKSRIQTPIPSKINKILNMKK
jgi:hypothetical protein